MKSYAALISARFRTLLQYRAAAVGGIVTQLFFGIIFIMIYDAFYRSSSAPQPMTFAQVVTYTWLGQGLLALFPWNVDGDIRAMVRSGTVAYELLRPVDLYAAWYCRALAWRTAPTLLRAVPLFAVAGLFLGLQPPASPASGGAFLVAVLGALLLACAISTLMHVSLLWTTSDDGIALFMPAFVLVCSGMSVPLPFFPAWAQRILYFLPFRGLIDTPFRLYVGNLPPGECLPLFAQQLAWTAALVLLGRWLMERGKRRLVVQGG